MSDFNSEHNRFVWADIPVKDLDRAQAFYSAVLGCDVGVEMFGDTRYGIIDHHNGNGGCLVVDPDAVTSTGGFLVYLNTNGRIRDAVTQVETHGGSVTQPIHSIGPHGCRALVIDSEGNRLALHSNTDA